MAIPALGAAAATLLRVAAAEEGAGAISGTLARLAAEMGLDEFGEGQTEITVPVASTAIRSIGYHIAGIITVEFIRGGQRTYEYPGSEELFMAFLLAPSKGQFFNANFERGPGRIPTKV